MVNTGSMGAPGGMGGMNQGNFKTKICQYFLEGRCQVPLPPLPFPFPFLLSGKIRGALYMPIEPLASAWEIHRALRGSMEKPVAMLTGRRICEASKMAAVAVAAAAAEAEAA